MFTRIPMDVKKFKAFIDRTDDLQVSRDEQGYTIYPKKPDGKMDYHNKEGRIEVKNKPMYYKWDWTAEESEKWSEYRKSFDELYEKYSQPENNGTVKKAIDKVINDFIEYDRVNGLVERVAISVHAPMAQFEVFNIRQDVMEIKTPLRIIRLKYEKAIPLNTEEKELIDVYVKLHEQSLELRLKAKELKKKAATLAKKLLDPLWEKYPVMKEKSDKAQNRVFLPPPPMKGAMSAPVQVHIPTQEEAQKAVDDFMEFSGNYHQELYKVYERIDELEKDFKWADDYCSDEHTDTDDLFDKIEEIASPMFEAINGSIDVMAFENDKEEFLGSWGEVIDEIQQAWDEWSRFIDNYNLLSKVYGNFIKYVNNTADEEDEEENTEVFNINDLIKSEPKEEENEDDPGDETIKRYKADLELKTNTYFDTQDWQVIVDHYQQQFDRKNAELAMKRALEQHPDDVLLLIRKAGILSDEHLYQQALELLKKAEAPGPPFPPQLFTIKANIYLQLQSPESAIPLYRRLLKQDVPKGQWWKKHAYEQLIDIYHNKKDYAECLNLSIDLLKENPDDEYSVEKIALYYNYTGNTKEAEKVLLNFVQYHPKSSVNLQRLGHIYFANKNYRNAVDYFDKAFKVDREENYGALKYKANALMELQQYDEAAICYEQCLLYFKIAPDYHVSAAKAYEKMEMMPQVIYHYRKALSLDPDCKEAIDFLLELNKKKISS
jgi:tetratricopeptide (TPR) repeat protein